MRDALSTTTTAQICQANIGHRAGQVNHNPALIAGQ
jgi:hypothetical protein